MREPLEGFSFRKVEESARAVQEAADRAGLCGPQCGLETVADAVADGWRTVTFYCGDHGLKSVKFAVRR